MRGQGAALGKVVTLLGLCWPLIHVRMRVGDFVIEQSRWKRQAVAWRRAGCGFAVGGWQWAAGGGRWCGKAHLELERRVRRYDACAAGLLGGEAAAAVATLGSDVEPCGLP